MMVVETRNPAFLVLGVLLANNKNTTYKTEKRLQYC